MATTRLATWRGEPAVVLAAGDLEATFVPSVAMLGVSLRHRGDECLAPVSTIARYRGGHVTGIPLLHPWANRLGERHYRIGRVDVTVPDDVPVDKRGLPIHGTVNRTAFTVTSLQASARGAHLRTNVDTATTPELLEGFPFPHRLDIEVGVGEPAQLTITTTLRPTGRRAVPASFGWHPYFQLPDAPREAWELRLPARRHAELDARQLPTGRFDPEPADDGPIRDRCFDDHNALGRDRRFVLRTPGRTLTLEFPGAYRYAQVYVPAGKPFAAIEPMVAPVNALVSGTAPLVAPGRALRATWRATLV